MSLSVELGVRRGTLDLDVALEVEPGELVAVLGPNGAGKSTLLRCLAGLLPIDSGSIRIDDRVVDAPADDTFVPPEQRPIGVVFQDYLLFDTMTVLDNVAFGLRARGADRTSARAGAATLLERVGLTDRADDRPAALSGGQAQRVALARALAPGPRLLLLDEPLAALDAGVRGTVRRELRRLLAGFDGMRVMVTHDPVDAYVMADRVVVLEEGHVAQAGSLADVTAHPRSRYVADLVGVNLVRGVLADGVVTTAGGAAVVVADDALAGEVFAAIRPESVSLHRTHPEGSPRNVWELTVTELDVHADRARIGLAGALALVAEITSAAVAELAVRPGDRVWASVKATEIAVYPA